MTYFFTIVVIFLSTLYDRLSVYIVYLLLFLSVIYFFIRFNKLRIGRNYFSLFLLLLIFFLFYLNYDYSYSLKYLLNLICYFFIFYMAYNFGFRNVEILTFNKRIYPFVLLIFFVPFLYFVFFGSYSLDPLSFDNLNGYVSGFLSVFNIPSYKHSFVWFIVLLVILSSVYFLDKTNKSLFRLFFYLLPLSPFVFSSKGALFSLFLLPLIKTPYRYILFSIFFFFSSVFLFYFFDPYLDGFRNIMWLTSLNSLLENPFGIGPGVSLFYLHESCDALWFSAIYLNLMCDNNLYGFESSFFFFLFEYGFLGLPFFIFFTIFPFYISTNGLSLLNSTFVYYARALSFGSFVGNHVFLPWHVVSLSIIFMLFGYLHAKRFSFDS